MEFGKSNWITYEQGINKEWLLTNGIGGFSSSSIIGSNARRYHGLLVASLNPPISRHLILSKLDESIEVGGNKYNLYSHQTPEGTMDGYLHLQSVQINHIPTFVYNVEDILIEKSICMVYGKNTVALVYKIKNGDRLSKLSLTPLINFRDYHNNSSKQYLCFERKIYDKDIIIRPCNYDLDIKIHCSEGYFEKLDDCYFMNMDYAIERERGLYSLEDHYIPGYFDIVVKPNETKDITVVASIEREIESYDGLAILKNENERVASLVKTAGYEDEFADTLVRAADNFIVYRKSTAAKTIIAGYPWFADWGRDTMIAFAGITLATKRFQDAKEILYTFSRYVRDGLIPNMFPDEGQEPAYNSVDAALWYFEAINKYLKYTNDYKFINENIFSGLVDIIEAYMTGTKFKIHMDKDHLISSGDENIQLTWMDAKVGDWVVTPRQGKAVEINALWYNSLKVMEHLTINHKGSKHNFGSIAQKVKESFVSEFWNEEGQCLYDVVNKSFKDSKVRPNQIFAVSLSNPIIEGEMAQKIVRKVWKELYTAYGIRSLSPKTPEYIGTYIGDQYNRDSAYHQGTVWSWPMGHFITAFLKAYGYTAENKLMARNFIKPFVHHLSDACVGSISEIFDGNEPLIPRGCFAQAWSVGEILRAYTEDIL